MWGGIRMEDILLSLFPYDADDDADANVDDDADDEHQGFIFLKLGLELKRR